MVEQENIKKIEDSLTEGMALLFTAITLNNLETIQKNPELAAKVCGELFERFIEKAMPEALNRSEKKVMELFDQAEKLTPKSTV